MANPTLTEELVRLLKEIDNNIESAENHLEKLRLDKIELSKLYKKINVRVYQRKTIQIDWEKVYKALSIEFNRKDIEKTLDKLGYKYKPHNIGYFLCGSVIGAGIESNGYAKYKKKKKWHIK